MSLRFDAAFVVLTDTCNACHRAEQVPFIRVEAPTLRVSIVRGTDDGASTTR
jgi:hypothetical protein